MDVLPRKHTHNEEIPINRAKGNELDYTHCLIAAQNTFTCTQTAVLYRTRNQSCGQSAQRWHSPFQHLPHELFGRQSRFVHMGDRLPAVGSLGSGALKPAFGKGLLVGGRMPRQVCLVRLRL